MSTTTAFKVKGNPKMVRFVTQQYVTGLYVAIYTEGDPLPVQSGSDLKEVDFHRELRKKIAAAGDTFLKEESDALNRVEVIKAQVKFAVDYCKRKGWPLGPDTNPFGKLGKRRLLAIRNRPEFKVIENNLVWE